MTSSNHYLTCKRKASYYENIVSKRPRGDYEFLMNDPVIYMLPDEIFLCHLFPYLDMKDRFILCSVSKRFKNLAEKTFNTPKDLFFALCFSTVERVRMILENFTFKCDKECIRSEYGEKQCKCKLLEYYSNHNVIIKRHDHYLYPKFELQFKDILEQNNLHVSPSKHIPVNTEFVIPREKFNLLKKYINKGPCTEYLSRRTYLENNHLCLDIYVEKILKHQIPIAIHFEDEKGIIFGTHVFIYSD